MEIIKKIYKKQKMREKKFDFSNSIYIDMNHYNIYIYIYIESINLFNSYLFNYMLNYTILIITLQLKMLNF